MMAKKPDRAISEQPKGTPIPTQNIKRKKITTHLGDRKGTRSLKKLAMTNPFPSRENEEALRRSEERYRTIHENIEEAYFEDDLAGNFTFVNDVLCRLLGYTRQELIGMNYAQHINKEDAKKLREIYNRVYRTGETVKAFDLEAIKKDGTKAIYETSVSLMRDWEGKPIGFQGISRNVTERKRTEEALRRSEERYRTILEEMEEGYFETDLAGNLTFINDAGCRNLGYPREELIGVDNRMYADGENRKKAFQTFTRVSRTGQPCRILDYELTRKDGTKVVNELSVSLIRDPDGKPIGFRGISHHVTERRQAEEALRESEKRYRQVIQNAVDIIYTTDANGNFTYANPAALTTTGYSLEELQRFNYLDLILPEHRDRVSKILISQFRERQPTTYVEFPFFNKSGDVVWFGQNASLVIEREKRVGFHVIARDITERKQMEDQLRQSEERFRRLVETMGVGLSAIDPNGVITYVNDQMCRMLGYSKEEFIGRPTTDFNDQVSRKRQEEILAKRRKGVKDPTPYEIAWVTKDGRKVDTILTPTPAFSAGGEFTSSFAMFTDITERKRAEEALRQSEERYRTNLESIQEGYFETDLNGNYTFVNDANCKFLGYTREELIGMNYQQHTGEEVFKRLYPHYRELYRTGKPIESLEFEAIRKDGTKVIYETSVTLIKDSKGKPIGIRGVSRNITERKRMEDELHKSEERAKQLARENEIMAKIGRIVSSTLNIEEVYERFAEEVRKFIQFERITINNIIPKKIPLSSFIT